MIQNIITLTLHDLAVSFKNKTVYLMLFIPLFVFFSLNVVDRPENGHRLVTQIGLVRGAPYFPALIPTLEASPSLFKLTLLADEGEGRQLLADKKLDGVLLPRGKAAQLLVLNKDSVKTLAILEELAALQRAAEARGSVDWVADVSALHEAGDLQNQTLPIWVLMLILLVGFLIVPPQVAEEKEKKLLLGLLQTPVEEWQWLAAKVITGMTLAMASVGLLHALSRVGMSWSYVAFLVAGSFCFSSMGVLLGFLCKTQASARALGVIFYLPHLLPSALSEFSTKLSAVACFVPSYQLFIPLRTILLEGGTLKGAVGALVALLLIGAASCGVAQELLKRRWLM